MLSNTKSRLAGKKTILLFLFVFSSVLLAQQDQFIIGVDWINPTYPHPYNQFQPLSETYWNLLESFGVNFGRLTIGRGNSGYIQLITNELAKAHTRDISIFLETYSNTGGRRWMYQVERNYDFGAHISGDSAFHIDAEPHWSQVKVYPTATNFWQLVSGIHQPGYVAENVLDDDQQPDSATYYVRLKIRKTGNISGSTPIVKVWIINKNYPTEVYHTFTLTAGECSLNVWQEKYLGNFFKVTEPEYIPIEDRDNIILTDSLGMLGVPDYTVTTTYYTPYEIKIEWFGDVSCDLDYLVIEDESSYILYNHGFDSFYTTFVNQIKNIPGLGKIQIWEEPWRENFLAIRYQKRLIDNILGAGNEDKGVLCFHPPYWSHTGPAQQFLAQTELDVLLANIYPIPYYSSGQQLFVVPYDPDYNSILQNRFNTDMIGVTNSQGLKQEINIASRFEKPFWFVPQADEWAIPPGLCPDDLGAMWQREPSAYEIKAMANLGVCYGAKGIHYFMYSEPVVNHCENVIVDAGVTLLDDDDINYPVPRDTDYYGFPKWETVKQLNHKLASIGGELISLTWQSAFYIPQGQPTGTYITNVQSYYCPIEGPPCFPDPTGETYIQLGIFKKSDELNNENLEHFFVVNRRTLNNWAEQRDIKVNYDKSSSNVDNWQNWIVKEVGTEHYWCSGESGEFTTHYEAGDGKLFRLEPVVIAGGNLIYNETISSDIELHGDLYIESGVTLTVNADYHCYGNITVKDGGAIETAGGGKIYSYNGKNIITDGYTLIYGTEQSHLEIDFTNIENNSGIFVRTGSWLHTFDCTIKNSGAGIYTEQDIANIRINNVDFYNCDNYCINISGPSSSTPRIYENTFSNCFGAVLANNLGEIEIQYNQIINNDIGINLINVAHPIIFSNTLISNKNMLPGVFLESCDGIIWQNNISGFTNGIYLGNSSPAIGQNEITNNLYHGIYVGTGSLPEMSGEVLNDPPEYYMLSGYNLIQDNGNTLTGGVYDTDGSEIFINNNANVVMENGCNSIVDDRCPNGDCPLHYYNTQLLMNSPNILIPISVHAEYNFWGDSPYYHLEDRFGYLRVYYEPNYNEPCEQEEGSGEGLFITSSEGVVIDTLYPLERTIDTLSATESLYASADEEFITANYDDAETIYSQIINSNDTLFAKLNAYRRLYEMGKLTSKPTSYFDDLYNTFSLLSQSTEDSLLIKMFSQLGSLSLVGQKEYVPAIEEFDQVIQNNPGTEEAVLAEIDALTTALLIEEEDSTLGKTSAKTYLVNPDTYQNRIKNILKRNFGSNQNVEEANTLPESYYLYQNYPNPFNPITTIKYDLVNVQDVKVTIYDILGREIITLVNEQQQPGSYQVSWNASNVASGIYIYQLRTEEFVNSKKMVLLK